MCVDRLGIYDGGIHTLSAEEKRRHSGYCLGAGFCDTGGSEHNARGNVVSKADYCDRACMSLGCTTWVAYLQAQFGQGRRLEIPEFQKKLG